LICCIQGKVYFQLIVTENAFTISLNYELGWIL
jgi:hypothetical protein